jgi:hypothetical protein
MYRHLLEHVMWALGLDGGEVGRWELDGKVFKKGKGRKLVGCRRKLEQGMEEQVPGARGLMGDETQSIGFK